MKFCFETHDEEEELYLPIAAYRYEQLIENEANLESLKRKLTYDYQHDDYSKYKKGLISYSPIEVLQMMGLHRIVDMLEGELNAAENQKSED